MFIGGRTLDVRKRSCGHLRDDRSVTGRRYEAVHQSYWDQLHASNVVHCLSSVQVEISLLYITTAGFYTFNG